jgi:hypothetical protein
MKVFLMYRDKDFDVKKPLPANSDALVQDLELNTLFGAMAHDDKFLLEVVKEAVLSRLDDASSITYRQQVLGDCLEHPTVIRELYDLAVEAIHNEKDSWWLNSYHRSPGLILSTSIRMLELYVASLVRLRRIAGDNAELFHSEGFVRFFAMIKEELDNQYFAVIQDHLRRLKFEGGTLISAELGKGLKGSDYTLRRPLEERQGWMKRLFGKRGSSYSFEVADRDEAGHEALRELHERGINGVADALAQSTNHILSFFVALRTELAFYVGCLNLHDRLAKKGEAVCIPEPLPVSGPALGARSLYDACLSLRTEGKVVGNDLDADKMELVVITGANQGGKSTFLRSVGLAQLMMQCGMYVSAENFRANICAGIFTHFKREEDTTMKSGKLDEELKRMSDVADHIKPNCILLCNESFASTNEREGSEIARQVLRAFLESGVKVLLVTHMFELAHSFYELHEDDTLFLRAERLSDGRRTFRITEGEPLSTSHGEDLYRDIFGSDGQAANREVFAKAS